MSPSPHERGLRFGSVYPVEAVAISGCQGWFCDESLPTATGEYRCSGWIPLPGKLSDDQGPKFTAVHGIFLLFLDLLHHFWMQTWTAAMMWAMLSWRFGPVRASAVFGQESRIRNKLQAGYIWIILGWKHLSALETSVDMNEVEAQSTGAETPYYIYIFLWSAHQHCRKLKHINPGWAEIDLK